MQVFADRTGTRSNGQGRKQATSQSQTQLSFAQARSALEHAVSGGTGGDEEEEIDDDDEAEDNEDDVPETMDPSELISMLEGMEKYTVDEDSVQRGSDFGVDRTGLSSASLDQPSLLKDNLEEEDANVGRNFVLSSVPTRDGTTVNSSKEGETILLATPLPGHNEQGLIVIKHDLDGAVFSSAASSWDHVATMPALAFVLASKRDAQRVHIHKRTSEAGQEDRYVVLAFESAPQVTGSGSTAAASGAGNLFLYYSPSSPDTKNAASRVVRLGASDSNDAGGGASGALLGVCSARLPRSGGSEGEEQLEDTLICLCENRILLLRGVL
uniref:Uncharacterized protein n=2 Tax=Kalmanozyma brasiliensis (strain GHG001) TaxID=1365824 RepID=V5E869_KALBG